MAHLPKVPLLSIAMSAALLSGTAAQASLCNLTIEAGGGGTLSQYKGTAPIDFIGQPIELPTANFLGGRYWGKGGAIWCQTSPKIGPFRIGLEYIDLEQRASVTGEALKGVGPLTDPTFLTGTLNVRRKQTFLNLAFDPLQFEGASTFMSVGVGKGRSVVDSFVEVKSDFLKNLNEVNPAESDLWSMQGQLGYDMHLFDSLFLGLRSKVIRDFGKPWEGRGKSTDASFFIVAGWRLGGIEKHNQKRRRSDDKWSIRLDAGYEFVHGSYDTDFNIKTESPKGKKQTLKFKSKDFFNGTSGLMQASLWVPVPFLCSGKFWRNQCDFELGVQYMDQSGFSTGDITVLEEGPLVKKDEHIDFKGTVDIQAKFLNFAYSPKLDGRWHPHVGLGIGRLNFTGDFQNQDEDKDVFTQKRKVGTTWAPQLFFGLDYELFWGLRLGVKSRYMVRQLSYGLSLKGYF